MEQDHHSSASRELLILYATETGTAQETADRIARECRKVCFHCRVQSMDVYPPETLISEHLVIFVVSTTGWGAEPRAMTSLWNMLLRSDLPSDLFEDMDFCVFGLGDTAYEKFCWPAKKLSRRMQSLGGYEICPRGEGDEQHRMGVDGALDPWIEGLLDVLTRLYPLPHEQDNIPAGLPPPRVSLSNVTSDSFLNPDPLDEDMKFHTASVKCNRRITAEDWFQDVRHFEFSFEDDIQYNPGDVAVIHPSAAASEVDSFLVTMGWANDADDFFTVEHTMLDQTLPDHLPKIISLRILFTRYLDFNAVPRRSFFQLLRYFATDELEREKLDEFVSIEGADEMYDYCQRVKRTIWEVLSEFRSARIPRGYVFDLFPPLRPREFSIASSIKLHPHEIHLCVAIVRYRTKLKVPRKGVCTSYLSGLNSGDTLCIGLRKGFISLPTDLNIPVVCVGPGTGVAPMRGVIEQRIHEGYTSMFGCWHTPLEHPWVGWSRSRALHHVNYHSPESFPSGASALQLRQYRKPLRFFSTFRELQVQWQCRRTRYFLDLQEGHICIAIHVGREQGAHAKDTPRSCAISTACALQLKDYHNKDLERPPAPSYFSKPRVGFRALLNSNPSVLSYLFGSKADSRGNSLRGWAQPDHPRVLPTTL